MKITDFNICKKYSRASWDKDKYVYFDSQCELKKCIYLNSERTSGCHVYDADLHYRDYMADDWIEVDESGHMIEEKEKDYYRIKDKLKETIKFLESLAPYLAIYNGDPKKVAKEICNFLEKI